MPAPSAEARRIRGEYFTPATPGGGGARARAPRHRPRTAHRGRSRRAATAPSSAPPARVPRRHGSTGWSSTRRTPPPPVAACPRARILVGDALRGGWDALVRTLPDVGSELWLGNPPYNGTSPCSATRRPTVPSAPGSALDDALPRGTSLRDDYAFFLLLASERLAAAPGCPRLGDLGHAPRRLPLRAAPPAPARPARAPRGGRPRRGRLPRERGCGPASRSGAAGAGPAPSPRFRTWAPGDGPLERRRRSGSASRPRSGACGRSPPRPSGWTRDGAPPASRSTCSSRCSCTGLKTRFDELLVDDDAGAASSPAWMRSFAPAISRDSPGRTASPRRSLPKLEALRRTPGLPPRADPEALRPFHRWAGRHRAGSRRARAPSATSTAGSSRAETTGWSARSTRTPATASWSSTCASSRSPRRSSRRRAASPRTATPASRPLLVPERIRSEGPRAGRSGAPLGPLVPNLSPAGLAWAERVGGPREAFRRIAAFIAPPGSRMSGRRPSAAAASSRSRCATNERGPRRVPLASRPRGG